MIDTPAKFGEARKRPENPKFEDTQKWVVAIIQVLEDFSCMKKTDMQPLSKARLMRFKVRILEKLQDGWQQLLQLKAGHIETSIATTFPGSTPFLIKSHSCSSASFVIMPKRKDFHHY